MRAVLAPGLSGGCSQQAGWERGLLHPKARLGLRTPFSMVPLCGCWWQASLWPAQWCLSSRWLYLAQQVFPGSRQEPPVLYDPPGKAHSHHSVLLPHAPFAKTTSP